MSATDELLTPRTINVQSYSDTHAKVALEPLERKVYRKMCLKSC
jgi:hypothetical protein